MKMGLSPSLVRERLLAPESQAVDSGLMQALQIADPASIPQDRTNNCNLRAGKRPELDVRIKFGELSTIRGFPNPLFQRTRTDGRQELRCCPIHDLCGLRIPGFGSIAADRDRILNWLPFVCPNETMERVEIGTDAVVARIRP